MCEKLGLIKEREKALWGTKIGGWPAVVQRPIEHPILLQVSLSSEPGSSFGDGGCIYIWREAGEWRSEVQFY